MPDGVDTMEFRFHGGDARAFDETALAALPDAGRVLLVSPFIRPKIVGKVFQHFQHASSIRLVAGRSELDRLARSRTGKLLSCYGGGVEALSMLAASDEATKPPEDGDDPEIKDDRGLHAKVCAVTDGDIATLIVGSANLTPNAWTGENWEAFVVARGSASIAEELQTWSQQAAAPYIEPPEPDSVAADAPSPLDVLRNRMATLELTLTEKPGTQPVLESAELGTLLAKSACAVRVGRLTEPNISVPWPAGNAQVELDPCDPSLRTAFLHVNATWGDDEATWVQMITVRPEITIFRDKEAVVRVLGADFLAYLASLLGTGSVDELDSEFEREAQRKRSQMTAGKPPRVEFCLEDLIRRVGSDGAELDEVNRAVVSYRDVLARAALDEPTLAQLKKFDSLWAAISEGLRIP
jgi:hypothetical protein